MRKKYLLVPFTLFGMILAGCNQGGDSIYPTAISIVGSGSLSVGGTSHLTVEYTPSETTVKEVTWSIADSEIASIDNQGLITGLKYGETTVTAVANAGNSKTVSASMPVVVNHDKNATVESIKVVDQTNSYELGQSFKFDGKVIATYTDGYSEVVSDYTYNEPAMNTEGSKTVTVSYVSGDKTYTSSFSITVSKVLVVNKITLSGFKTEFVQNQKFVFGGIVTALYSNGLESQINNYKISVPDMSVSGKQNITVTYSDNHGNTVSASYTITIKENDTQKITSLTISESSLALTVGTNRVLSASYAPSTASVDKLVWSTSNKSVADVAADGTVSAKAEGTATITVTTEPSYGISATCKVTVSSEKPVSGGAFTLLTDNTLTIGDFVIFASGKSGSIKAMGQQSTNNRAAIATTVSNNQIALEQDSGVYSFEIREGYSSGSYSFYDDVNNGYLVASGNTSNQLKVENTVTQNSSWKITSASDGAKTIQSVGNNARGTMRYNDGSSIFACYSSSNTRMQDVYMFTKSGIPVYANKITISGNNKIGIGYSSQLNVSFDPIDTNQNKVTWSSSNTTVATVSNGLVQGLKEGVATITASVAGANNTTITDTFDVTVSRIAVTGVTLNENTREIGVGKTFSLTANVLPQDASNKGVSWSSSNASVASVSNGVVSAKSVGSAVITVTTEDGNYQAKCTVAVSEVVKDDWTILIYMCGSDLESGNGLATSDLKEIVNTKNQPDDVNIIVETGGASSWKSTYGINKSKLQRHEIKNNKLTTLDSFTYSSMGLSSTLQSFVSWGMTTYPADKTGLIMWNHGGAMVGVCFDEKSDNDCLTTAEVASALRGAGLGGSNKLEFIGYDACLMGVADIASVNSDYANYMIASEESEGGYGWDYDNWLPTLYSNPGDSKAIFEKICTTFISDSKTSGYTDSTLAAYDLSKIDSFITEFDKFTGTLTSSNWSTVKSCYSSALKFGLDGGKSYYSIADAQSMITLMASKMSKDATKLLQALNELVIVNKYGTYYKSSKTPCGICLFFAGDSSSNVQTSKSDYTVNDTKFTAWRQFNISNGTFY